MWAVTMVPPAKIATADVRVEFDEIARSVAARFHARAAHYYVRSKLKMDPVGRVLFDLAGSEPFGEVADVACGRGQLGMLLLEAGRADALYGLDWDEAKIAIARGAASDLPRARFDHGDVRTASFAAADTVLLVDILHYLARDEQDALLRAAARAARARVVVRDVSTEPSVARWLTQGWEVVTTTLGYNRGARVAPRSVDEMAAILEAEGFEVTRERYSAKALANVLLVARRRG